MLFHALFENIYELYEARSTLIEGIAHNLDQVWHKLVWDLGEEYSPLISQGLEYGGRKAEGRCREWLGNLSLKSAYALEKS